MSQLTSVDFPCEDRIFGGNSLFVDLIPETSWFTNVRSRIPRKTWDAIRRIVYDRAHYTCEVCGRKPARRSGDWIECHERWEYTPGNDKGHGIQTLKRFIALCTACHEATHMGLANVRGRGEIAMAHLKKVTGMSEEEARRHVRQAFRVWEQRSELQWTLEMPLLQEIAPEFVGERPLHHSIILEEG